MNTTPNNRVVLPRLALPSIIVVGLVCGLIGIDWGLPSARRVALLGESVNKVRAELSARTTRELSVRGQHAAMLVMQPAEEQLDLPRLVRRYLLFTDAPDEGLTLLGLANFKPRQLDFNPRMVEYGGLHVYATGAAMTLAHLLGFGRISSDVTHYADHPQDIARLYIAGRLLMVLYNIGIAILLFFFGNALAGENPKSKAESARPAKQIQNPKLAGWLAALLWLLSPLSLSLSHFINPHLPAGFYGTLAAWLAWRTGASGSRRAWIGAAAASGAAAACALNAAVSLLAPLLIGLLLVHESIAATKQFTIVNCFVAAARPIGLAVLVAATFYLAFNPYFFANLDVLREELTGYRQVREPQASLLGPLLYVVGALPSTLGLVGVAVAVFGAARLWQEFGARGCAIVIYATVGLVLTSWLMGSEAGQAHTIRFATFLVPPLCVFIAVALTGPWPRLARAAVAALIALGLVGGTVIHLASFTRSPRDEAGEFINRQLPAESAIAVPKSPGPYKTPAFDFSRLRSVSDPNALHDYVVQVEEGVAPLPPAGFELMKSFPDSGSRFPTPLSFSGRFVRVYRRAAGSGGR